MKPEHIRSELIKVIDEPDDRQGLYHLVLKLKGEDSDTVLSGLLEIFFQESLHRYQAVAGGLLWKLKPEYRRNLREDIRLSLQGWDVSIEELPWYFAEVLGIERVRSEVESVLNDESLEDIEKRRARTYLYWLLIADREEFRERLNRTWNGRLRG